MLKINHRKFVLREKMLLLAIGLTRLVWLDLASNILLKINHRYYICLDILI